MKISANSLRQDYHRQFGDPESETNQPANWRVYAEWLEQKLFDQSEDSLGDYPSEADKKRKGKEIALFLTKIHYANKLLLKYNPSNTSKNIILLRLDQAENITQLRKAYKQIVSEF